MLVGNVEGGVSSNVQDNSISHAQAFTTDDNSNSYVLDSVAALITNSRELTANDRSRVKAQLWSYTTAGASEVPACRRWVATLANAGERIAMLTLPPESTPKNRGT